MPRSRKPTYDELVGLVAAQAAQIAELERQLGSTSRNSSKPPSADGLAKPAPKSLRRPSERHPGGQPGHPGAALRQVDHPDHIVTHAPDRCPACGGVLDECCDVGVVARQVVDLPQVRAVVTEHQILTRRCACGHLTAGTAPAGVAAPVSYGPAARAAMVYLAAGQYIPIRRVAVTMADLLGMPVSTGAVAAAVEQAGGEPLDAFTGQVAGRIAASPVVHADETGLRVAGKLHWVHSASTGQYSHISVHRRRGRAGMDAAGILPGCTGVLVHDAWAPYDTYEHVDHQLCCAHLIRELVAVADHHDAHDPPGAFCWARQVLDALLPLIRDPHAAAGQADPGLLEAGRRLIVDAARLGADSGVPGEVGAKHRALARRISARIDDYLRFATTPGLAPDNNAAEREIRMVKVHQKVSGCHRTLTGAEGFLRLRSYLSTATKQACNTYQVLGDLFNGQAWTPATT